MAEQSPDDIHTFMVDSYFQKMARRAGGIPRQQALEFAQLAIDKAKMSFGDWLARELDGLTAEIRKGRLAAAGDVSWAEGAILHARHIRDVGTTMGFGLLTFITGNLCEIFEAIIAGAAPSGEVIDCHVDALLLAKQEQYRHLRPEQLPELSLGLRRMLDVTGHPLNESPDN
jgi:hypothetical protein